MAPKSKTKKGIAIEIEDSTLINEIEEKCNLSKPEIKEMMLRIADIVLKEMETPTKPKSKPLHFKLSIASFTIMNKLFF